jgi:mannose-6-phosphate isomerase-like protein (cupin superfamily)
MGQTETKWGWWQVLAARDLPELGRKMKVKLLYFNPGQKTSLQYHNHRSEIWTVIFGEGTAIIEEDGIMVVPIYAGETYNVGLRTQHQIKNMSNELPLLILETQIGEMCEEEDIVRLEEDLGL